MSGKQWYYGQNGNQFGPVSWEELQQLAASGRVRGHDMVWCQGMTEWEPAERVAALLPREAPVGQADQRWRPPPAAPPAYGPPRQPGGAPVQYYAPVNAGGRSHQGMAVAGLILAFVMPLIGLIVSGIALGNMKRDNNPEGRGLALAGLIVSGIVVGGFALMAVIMCAGASASGY